MPLHSAQGMSLFRVHRDDTYLQQMLAVIRRFYVTHVKAKRPPPQDMFFQGSDYQASATRFLKWF